MDDSRASRNGDVLARRQRPQHRSLPASKDILSSAVARRTLSNVDQYPDCFTAWAESMFDRLASILASLLLESIESALLAYCPTH
jgi:hypothetical protein